MKKNNKIKKKITPIPIITPSIKKNKFENANNKYFDLKYSKSLVPILSKNVTQFYPSVLKYHGGRFNKKIISGVSLKSLRAKYAKSAFFISNRFILKYSIYKLIRDLRIINSSLTNSFYVLISPLEKDHISQFLYARFITRRLAQRFSLFDTFKVLKRYLSISSLRGYLLKCSGRFTKKQRASIYLFRKGSIPIGTFNAKLSYHSEIIRLKYGTCCIKLWINR